MSDSWKRRLIACLVGAVLTVVLGLTGGDPRWLYGIVAISLAVYIWLYDRAYKRGEIPGSHGAHGSKT